MNIEEWRDQFATLKERVAYLEGRMQERDRRWTYAKLENGWVNATVGQMPVLQWWRLGPEHGSFPTLIIDGQEYVIVRLPDQFVLREYEEGDEKMYRADRGER